LQEKTCYKLKLSDKTEKKHFDLEYWKTLNTHTC